MAGSNLEPVAVALAMTGDVNRAQAIADDLGRRFPDDTLLQQVSIPVVRALIELDRKAPEKAIEALQAATPYEMGSISGTPSHVHSRPRVSAGEARGGSGCGISEDRRSSRHRSDSARAFAGQTGPGPGVCDDRRHGESAGLPIRISLRCGKMPTPTFPSLRKRRRSTNNCISSS